jgi:hypothetical protein
MSGHIFNIQDDGRLVEMNEEAFSNEDLFQELLEKYPDLLAGDQIDSASPRRWLLIKREMGVPAEESGGDRWSLDHLFLDQDAIPTLVEVKRSSDTRIRREVVGQMLDYAANAVVYWPVEKMRAEFEGSCDNPNEQLATLLGEGADPEVFWQQVKTNLQAKKIRLLFVADVIPPELRRIVEFLNDITDPTEVLAVEIRHYVGQGMKTLVPRVIGQTAEAEGRKGGGSRPSRQWDEGLFMQDLRERCGETEVAVAVEILAWVTRQSLRVAWGKGGQYGALSANLDGPSGRQVIIGMGTSGNLSIPFGHLRQKPPFSDETKRRELLRRINEVPGVQMAGDLIDRLPNLSLSLFQDRIALEKLFGILDWVIREIKACEGV